MLSARPAICLNMIVRNESALIERCLAAAAGHIDCYVICDTGSTDDTVERILSFFAARNIPGVIAHTTFHNFEQARNFALDAARDSDLEFDHLLLCDADMELVVERPAFREELAGVPYLVAPPARTAPTSSIATSHCSPKGCRPNPTTSATSSIWRTPTSTPDNQPKQ